MRAVPWILPVLLVLAAGCRCEGPASGLAGAPDPPVPQDSTGPVLRVSLGLKDVELREIVRVIARIADVEFAYDPGEPRLRQKVTVSASEKPWQTFLEELLARHGLVLLELPGGVYGIRSAESEADAGRRATVNAREADELWARALFASSCDTNYTVRQAEDLFLEALRKADNRALILISLGDYHSGPMPMRQALRGFSRTVAENVASEGGRLAESRDWAEQEPFDADVEQAAAALHEIMKGAMRQSLDELTEAAMTAPQSRALRCYLAAAAEDPTCTIAWYRIATSTEAGDELRRRALSNFVMRDPNNGLPHYLEAGKHLGREDLAACLVSVKAGNSKSLRIPQSPMPKQFSLAFPDREPYRAAGLAGRPVSAGVFGISGDNAGRSGLLG